MPTAAMASHYWPGDGTSPVPLTSEGSSFPWWAEGTYVGSMLPYVSPSRTTRKHLYHRWIQIKRHIPLRILALVRAIRLIFSRNFSVAAATVDEIAHDPSSRNLKTWAEINRLTVSNPAEGENAYRHLLATVRMGKDIPRQDRAILADLAWAAIRAKHGK